jgi:metallophosphoesterase (TIGR00282 family)
MTKILFVGDIIGKYGRKITLEVLPGLIAEFSPHLIIANAENSAHGYGITEKVYQELLGIGIEAFTMGNHMWDKKELAKNIEKFPRLVRPANYPEGVPGQTYLMVKGVAMVNLVGRTFMPPMDCPFQTMEKLLPVLQKEAKIIIVDMHAEATSEKGAMAWFLDGKVSAVIGTHTHVMTADERIFPQGTAFISDAGMVGSQDSIIGMNKNQILKRFLTQMPEKFEPAEKGTGIFNAVLIEVDSETGKAQNIKRLSL